MTELLLQTGGLTPAELTLLASDVVTIALGLAIAYIAHRGYDRNDSRPMLYVAAGFVLVFGGPGVVFVGSLVAPLPDLAAGALTQLVELTGMVAILYGFLAPLGD
jgi:hypothetical protein